MLCTVVKKMYLFTDLETKRLFLKCIGPEDADFFYREFSDAEVNRFLFDAEPCCSVEEAEGWIGFYLEPEPRDHHRWIIILKESGEKIGTCGFHCWNRETGEIEVGYDLFPAFWGKGYTFEALQEMILFAEYTMHVKKIFAHIYVGNEASRQVAEKVGFVRTGQQYHELFRGQKYLHDIYCLVTPPAKPLSQLSLQELWHLFPISLVAPKKEWDAQYRDMENALIKVLPPCAEYRISHIGSTAVKSIMAKDIVDILLEVGSGGSTEPAATAAEEIGFLRMSETSTRISLNYGYTAKGYLDKVYHLHVRRMGDNDELYFRDLLLADPAVAAEYEALKLSLWKQYTFNRDAYTEAKSDFIIRHTAEAKALFAGRY